MDVDSETLWEVEYIEYVEWAGARWDYSIKVDISVALFQPFDLFCQWYGYDDRHNTLEPLKSLKHCKSVLEQFWADVGPHHRKRAKRAVGYMLTSSESYRRACTEKCQWGDYGAEDTSNHEPLAPPGVYNAEKDVSLLDVTHETDSGNVVQVPDPSLLSRTPEDLGFFELTANDRYKMTILSLKSKKIDASEVIYKRAKKDTKEDASWRERGCTLCYRTDDMDKSGCLLACQCRAMLYCKDCLDQWKKQGRPRSDGVVSCPQCRSLVYIIGAPWVFRTPSEDEERDLKRKAWKAGRKERNKQNKKEARMRKRMKFSEDEKSNVEAEAAP
ncbi:hypothetical protein VNI00_013502 [Paramarasmius palmivorus]|uniref:RING-type domain-containing protein n=1 Tax=Paramarasmius palmivorus TaxID=297713 RepID=A0AAW0BWH1_9AGAR